MIGFLGGTGPEGMGLALRFALAGEDIIIGAREVGKAGNVARRITEQAPGSMVVGGLNNQVADQADIVFVTLPYLAQKPILQCLPSQLDDKIVVDVVAPLKFSKDGVSALSVSEGSAALQAQEILVKSRVVAAFQTISAHDLLDYNQRVESDVIVCGDHEIDKLRVIKLSEKINGIRGIDGGGLANSGYVENITALLLNINRKYKARTAIRIVGI